MRGRNRAALDRRVQFQRKTLYDDGISQVETWADHGDPIWASRKDVSDGEKSRAGSLQAAIMARFEVRSSGFTRDLTPKDGLICDGLPFDITGIKLIGRLDRLEFSATARIDKTAP